MSMTHLLEDTLTTIMMIIAGRYFANRNKNKNNAHLFAINLSIFLCLITRNTVTWTADVMASLNVLKMKLMLMQSSPSVVDAE